MKSAGMLAALALAALLVPSAAMADDPNDPDMRDPRNRARDREIIRQMNLDQLAFVRERDARYAAGWEAYRAEKNGAGANAAYARARAANDRQHAEYDRVQAKHEQDMAAWRRAVALCRAGHYEHCDG